jgi:hypothetical protein
VSFVSNIAKTRIIGPSCPVDIFLLRYTGTTPTAQPIILAVRFEALAVTRLLGLWVRVLPGAWMLVLYVAKAKHLSRNIEVLSQNYVCRGRAIIAYFCVYVHKRTWVSERVCG